MLCYRSVNVYLFNIYSAVFLHKKSLIHLTKLISFVIILFFVTYILQLHG